MNNDLQLLVELLINNPEIIWLPVLIYSLISLIFVLVVFFILKKYYADKVDDVMSYVKEVDTHSRSIQSSIMDYINTHMKSLETLQKSYDDYSNIRAREDSCPFKGEITKISSIESNISLLNTKFDLLFEKQKSEKNGG